MKLKFVKCCPVTPKPKSHLELTKLHQKKHFYVLYMKCIPKPAIESEP